MTCYLYDGSYDGFLSAVFLAYREVESTLLRQKSLPGPTLWDTVTVSADADKAQRVSAGMRRLSARLPRTVYSAWLSELPKVEDAILCTLRLGFSAECNPMTMRYDDHVRYVAECAQKVGSEAHRFLQFVRFSEVHGVFVADVEPIYDILPLIGNHFHQRFGAQQILIRDRLRGRAVVSEEKGWFIAELSPDQMHPITGAGPFEQMWQRYFNAIANKARLNPKLQQHFIPLRYRAHLTEFQSSDQAARHLLSEP